MTIVCVILALLYLPLYVIFRLMMRYSEGKRSRRRRGRRKF